MAGGAPFLGMTLVVLAGIAGGAFAFPLRMKGVYAQENILLGAYVIGLLVIPLAVVGAAVPSWRAALGGASGRELLLPALCGVGWGLGAVGYAQGVRRIGIALTVSTVMGLTMAIGTVVPLAARWAAATAAVKGWVLGGTAVGVVGIALFGAAGYLRDRRGSGGARSFLAGFAWCIASGALSPLSNIGFDVASPIVARAAAGGADPRLASLVGWFPTWAGCLLTLIVAFGSRATRRGTWRLYAARGSMKDLLRTSLMGVLHFAGQAVYGFGAALVGSLGTSIGWAATMATQLLTANGVGIAMGEWRGAPRQSRVLLGVGISAVLAAVAALAWASGLPARGA